MEAERRRQDYHEKKLAKAAKKREHRATNKRVRDAVDDGTMLPPPAKIAKTLDNIKPTDFLIQHRTKV